MSTFRKCASPLLLPTHAEGQKRKNCHGHHIMHLQFPERGLNWYPQKEACLSWELLLSSMLLPTEELHSLAVSYRQIRNGAAKC